MTKQELRWQNMELENQIRDNENKIAEIEAEEIRDRVGKNADCNNCMYGCGKSYNKYGEYCVKGCYMKYHICNRYTKDNALSKYIRKEYMDHYLAHCDLDGVTLLLLGEDYESSDLLTREELFDKAIRILDAAKE